MLRPFHSLTLPEDVTFIKITTTKGKVQPPINRTSHLCAVALLLADFYRVITLHKLFIRNIFRTRPGSGKFP